jgi:hypothetical protein
MRFTQAVKGLCYFLPRFLLFSVFIIYLIFAFLVYFDYFEQYLYPLHLIQGEVEVLSDNILIGPYPHVDELRRLKKTQGITDVISLLNTSLPQEKALYNREERVARIVGVRLYSYPMSYFSLNSEYNRQVMDRIVEFIRRMKAQRKVYIHCYLGRHRTKALKKRLIEEGLVRSD